MGYFSKVLSGTTRPVATTLAAQKINGATSASVVATTGWETSTPVHGIMYRTDGNGDKVAGSQIDFKADVSGTTLNNFTVTAGTDDTYAIGTTVELSPTAAWGDDMATGILEEHNQDGTHSDVTADSIEVEDLTITNSLTISGNQTDAGWEPIGGTLSVATGYNQGNKSFEIDSSTDLTGTLSPGMRFKCGVSSMTLPTQSTDLEASSSQYWSKTSPSGLSFTDDFTCEAWVKLESYQAASTFYGIVSRRNADTEGWSFEIDGTGQVSISSLRIASNNRNVKSYQSIPLGRWVHVAATMDNSANTHTIYIDGVAVPTATSTTGTITALVQGTTALVVGAQKSAGTNPFDGKIADVRVWSAVRTATQIQDNMGEVLTGAESNLVAHFPMNGNGNDTTANANNLSANGSAAATNADNPFNIGSGTFYGIITKVTASKITVFTGTDYFIPNATITTPQYSTQKTPFGFPGGRDKWYVSSTIPIDDPVTSASYVALTSQALSVPVGGWRISMKAVLGLSSTSTNDERAAVSLSSNASTETHPNLTATLRKRSASAAAASATSASLFTSDFTTLSAQTTFTMIGLIINGGTLTILGTSFTPTVITAECAYL